MMSDLLRVGRVFFSSAGLGAMSDLLPEELWREQILPFLVVCDVVALRATSRAKAALITAGLLLQRIDACLERNELNGTVDVDRVWSAGDANQLGGLVGLILSYVRRLPACPRRLTGRRANGMTHVGYLLRCLYVLEQGGSKWRVMGMIVRLAAIYQLTPNGLPLTMSVAHLPTRWAFHQMPVMMSVYTTIQHQLSYRGSSLALQPAAINIDGSTFLSLLRWCLMAGTVGPFGVMPHGEMPASHRYLVEYKSEDPVIRCGPRLFPSFSAFLVRSLCCRWSDQEAAGDREVLTAHIGDRHPCYWKLLRADDVPQQLGMTVDHRYDNGDIHRAHPAEYRGVVVSGFRPGDAVAARLSVGFGRIQLHSTEPPVAGPAASLDEVLDVRFPVSMPMWRSVLKRFDLEEDVINRGRVLV
ncbi:unnamed protein product [Vitrella brassicaformis CCMP3155]|uniref:Uncharacterized protein n=1 Tax=Vitrella brassicaformis (strain CCMP3155) TaxID=1169540 RepID=A0A0G4EAD8_VITBC|nr:unnamed protein product [Vitrella brassicaformis CCMP3155]|eukprot:CEL92212.1 unnamed protein product [Vitrella brassicaformis CCMP3155]